MMFGTPYRPCSHCEVLRPAAKLVNGRCAPTLQGPQSWACVKAPAKPDRTALITVTADARNGVGH